MMLIDRKYFASDGDKFMFFVNDGHIDFIKFSVVYGHLPCWIRKFYWREFNRLPVLERGIFKMREDV